MLESYLHQESCFVTLTYDEEHLPSDNCVSVREGQLFLKRLRESIAPAKLRYFLCGEYGDITARPHYHVALFGLSDEVAIKAAWGKGHVKVGTLTPESAAYVVSYVTKRMTSFGDIRLKGRAPEFARMSLRPGLGAGAIDEISRAMVSKSGAAHIARESDVVRRIRVGLGKWPLGRYLIGKLRDSVGVDKDVVAMKYDGVLEALQAEGWEGRRARDRAREHSGARAKRLNQIAQSRKGVGL